MTIEDLTQAWRTNNTITLKLLSLCPDDAFELKPGSGKTIRSNFVHIIGVRRMWMEESMAREALGIPKLDWKSANREEIVDGLNVSSLLMEQLFLNKVAQTKAERMSAIGFFAYCIAHEAHHRSQIEVALRIAKREPEDRELYDLWEWSKNWD